MKHKAKPETDLASIIEETDGVFSVDDIQWGDNSTQDEELDITVNDQEEKVDLDDDNGLGWRLAVSAQNNRQTAIYFFRRLREISTTLSDVIAVNDTSVPTQEFAASELTSIADRWNIPFALRFEGGHWFLMLKPPEKHNDSYRVLTYNPFYEIEEFKQMSSSYNGEVDSTTLANNGIFVNSLANEQFTSGEYDLAFPIDEDTANKAELVKAKKVNLQPRRDVYNCGPATLLMAAIRAGMKRGNNLFKDLGREVMQNDLSTNDVLFTLLTREEILEQS